MITLNLHQAIAFLLAKATWCPKINRVFLRPIPSFFVRHYRLTQSRLNEKGQFKIQSYFKVVSMQARLWLSKLGGHNLPPWWLPKLGVTPAGPCNSNYTSVQLQVNEEVYITPANNIIGFAYSCAGLQQYRVVYMCSSWLQMAS